MEDLKKIVSRFPDVKNVKSITPFGSGHINDTYKVETATGRFILQRINHIVFKNVEGLTDNIVKVTQFLSQKLEGTDSDMQVVELFKADTGKYFVNDEDGNFWRVMSFIEGSKSYDLVENDDIAYKGGKAYGLFVKLLSDFPVDTLVDTIPDFHNIDFRLDNFRKAVKADVAGRVEGLPDEIEFVEKRAEEMRKILLLGQKGEIPLRVTHNDTKINNVLFNDAGEAISVIDLDTVMPGYIHYDFGDAIRTFTNRANEDEEDLSKVSMNIRYYKAFAEGFLSETKTVLTDTELKYLPFSARLMTYIIGLRFLTDYLDGDVYYKTKYATHNLVRAKVQFRLIESMEEQSEEMEGVV